MFAIFRYLTISTLLLCMVAVKGQYKPNWQSLDTRPLPTWYDEAKIGVFISWGPSAVPGFSTYGDALSFWEMWAGGHPSNVKFMKENYPPNFTYADFASQFKAEFYDADHLVDIIEASGAKYTNFITKHNDGFSLWPSKYSFNWNSVDVGPKRDLVGEFVVALRKKKDIKLGLYHNMFDILNPLYIQDKANKFKTRYFVYAKTIPQLYEIVNRYEPDLIWSDGDWQADDTYWQAYYFLAWLYNDSPVKDHVIVNDRWGKNIRCKHGGYFTCDDKFNPKHLMPRKWENAMTIDRGSWGYRRNINIDSFLTIKELLTILAETISCGGNLLMNIGLTADGRVTPVYEERLRQVGAWLKVNGEAVYATTPWKYQNDTATSNVWYTSKKNTNGTTDVYAFVLSWPTTNSLKLGAPVASGSTRISLLGYPKLFTFSGRKQGITINIPDIPFTDIPSQWAWVFKMTNLKNMG